MTKENFNKYSEKCPARLSNFSGITSCSITTEQCTYTECVMQYWQDKTNRCNCSK